MELTLWVAFTAGIISFISPCVLPLIPPYLCYIGGVTLDQLTAEDEEQPNQWWLIFVAFCFVLGFSTVFVALGTGASFIGQFLRSYQTVLAQVAGVVIIIMGLHFLGVFRLALLYKEARANVTQIKAGPGGAYVMGLAFAFGWTPCIGPVLAVILAMAGAENSASQGASLLAAYSLGIGLPFLAAALFAKPFMNWMKGFRRHLGHVEKTMGGLLVLSGVLFITGHMTLFATTLLEWFPALATIG